VKRFTYPIAALVIGIAAACGGSDDEPCTRPTGAVLYTYTERPGGDCGAMAEHLDVIDSQEGNASCAYASQVWSPDNCSYDATYTGCAEETVAGAIAMTDRIGAFAYVSATEWSGVAEYVITLPDGRACRSVYDVELVER
jgi:hypothetical protein